MYKYFNPLPATPEAAASVYKRLIFTLHPDHNPSPDATRQTQDLNSEYASLLAEFAYSGEYGRQQKAHAEGKRTAADYHDLRGVTDELRSKIEAVLNLGGNLVVELCGLWVWVTGETKPYKEQLGKNGLGFKWSPNKEAWYFAGVPTFNRKRHSLDEIRNMHGSVILSDQKEAMVTA